MTAFQVEKSLTAGYGSLVLIAASVGIREDGGTYGTVEFESADARIFTWRETERTRRVWGQS